MYFILNPLIINFFFILVPVILFYFLVTLLQSLVYRSADIFEYKIHNKSLSLFLIISYVIIIIVALYIMRCYNLPRAVDLNTFIISLIIKARILYSPFTEYSSFIKGYFTISIILGICIILLLVIRMHKLMYKEIYKVFLYIMAVHAHGLMEQVCWKFMSIAMKQDILHYFLSKLTHYYTKKRYGVNYNYDSLSFFSSRKLVHIFIENKYYPFIMKISPLFFILYDCVFNNFIITHVFYYLIFYIPLQLFKRFCHPFLHYAPYITQLLYKIYYVDESCVYAVSPNLDLIIKNYILSGVEMNPEFGPMLDTERYVSSVIRFVPFIINNNSDNKGIYVNVEMAYLHTDDHIHFFHVVEDEDGNPIHGGEWVVLANKLKK